MSKIKELFGVEVGEEFYLKWNFEEFCDKTMKYHFEADDYLHRSDNSLSTINPLSILLGVFGETKIVEIEKLILDDVEKKFIGNIIKPFDIKDITKVKCTYQDKLFIAIRLTNGEQICLPFFSSKSKMYKGMKWDKPYTPEELGI